MNLFVFGLGMSSLHFLRFHAAGFDSIAGTVRTFQKASHLSGLICAGGQRLETLVFDGSAADASVMAKLADATQVLVSIPPDGHGDRALACLHDQIAAFRTLETIVYLSTIGVYGDHRGRWIDETTPPNPSSERSRARLVAEQGWQKLGMATGKRVVILRLAGIYGPGQNAVENMREGTARRIVKKDQVFNRIHVEDIARAIEAGFALHSGGQPEGIYNITDNEPAPPQDVVAYAANLAGLPVPPDLPFETASLSVMARSFYAENKRVSNSKMLTELGVTLAYPTYREGLATCADDLLRRSQGLRK